MMNVGAAKQDITPPVGTELSGFIARLKPSDSVADPLHARALVAEADGRRIGLVQADLLGFSAWQVRDVRQFSTDTLDIAPEALLLSATHTHSGPGVIPLRGGAEAPLSYQRDVVHRINWALREASKRLAPATFETGVGPYSLGVNRRQETPHGVVLGVAPEKPCPTTLDVARLRTAHQEILLFSHACHPYILGGESLAISGDFPSLACQELERATETTAFFLNGFAGNIAPKSAFQGIAKAREEGRRLAAAVRNVGQTGNQSYSVAGASRVVHLPHLPLPTEAEIDALARQQERVVRPEEKTDAEVQRRIAAALENWRTDMGRAIRGEMPIEPVQCEVQVIRLGPLMLLGIAGEPFFEIGEAIRSKTRFLQETGFLWPLGYTNAFCGYIPTRAEYPRGGYEVDDSWKYLGLWKIDETCEERVTGAAVLLLDRH